MKNKEMENMELENESIEDFISDSFSSSIISETLSLNRAAHVLTRSGSLLDKLLKLEKSTACTILMRDYELSSILVAVKHEEHVKSVEEGFKGIEIVKEEGKMKELSISKKVGSKVSESKSSDTNSSVSKNMESKHSELKNSESKNSELKNSELSQSSDLLDNDPKNDNHHVSTESVRIELYCKNLFRPPRVGRVIRMVESVEDPNEVYIIELLK